MSQSCQIEKDVQSLSNIMATIEKASSEGKVDKFGSSSARVIHIQNAKLVEQVI